jgi:hypothetical protein
MWNLVKHHFCLVVLLHGPGVSAELGFTRDVLPILSDNCYACHGPDARQRKGGLRLDIRADALKKKAFVPGDPDASELIVRILHEDPEERMPQQSSERSLSEDQKQTLRRWIAEGAVYEKHWSFVPVKRPDPPLPGLHPVDAFVRARLQEEHLAPAPEAEPIAIIRRLSLDLTGLPPTPGEVDRFLADRSPGAYAKLVDRLLASPRYGEHMALNWLDAARYADTDGYQNDGPRTMWRWRDWVIEAYNRNLAFDRFTIEQLAGDLLPDAGLAQQIATGFNRNHRYNSEAGIPLDEFLLENAVDRVDTTATLWMGLTLGCARCHDHKYDPFSQKEYYQLIAFFNSVPESGRAVKFGNSEPWVISPTEDQALKLAEHAARIRRAKQVLAKGEADIAGAQAKWEAALPGKAKPVPPVGQGQVHHLPLGTLGPNQKIEMGKPVFDPGMVGRGLRAGGQAKVNLGAAAGFYCQSRFSLAFWLRPDRVDTGVILSNQAGGSKRPGLAVEMKEGRLQFYIITRWIAGVACVETSAPLVAGEWVHVTLTNDGSQSATGMVVYLNGERADTQIRHNTNSNTGGSKGVLKFAAGVFGDPFVGMIDELRVWTRTLWADEIAIVSVPETVRKLAAIERGARTPRQSAALRAAFLEHAAPPRLRKQAKAWFDARLAHEKYLDRLPTTMVMQETDMPKKTFLRKRGVYNSYGEVVSRGVPGIFPALKRDDHPNRLDLARWLVSGEHPLTARVAVNRYWQHYFGRGLVKTAEDFGRQGELPSHPGLLDWLAAEFVASGWDVKAMQKLIVTSATYRQQSHMHPEALTRDPANRLLARGPRQRLSAHAIRDQALAVSGLLVEKQGGPSVSPYQPANFWSSLSNMKYKQGKGDALYRRSLYTIWKRTLNPPSMALFDAPEREACRVNLKRTNTPLQALTLLNETLFVESARNLASRMLREGAGDPVHFGFREVLARPPGTAEKILLDAALAEYRAAFQADPAAARKLLKTGQSPVDAKLDPVELAAATTLANVLLNLDEAITKP